MLRDLKTSFLALLWLSLLTGVVYPLAITGIAQLAFPDRANGSLVVVDGVVRGSLLIGQNWRGESWFHGRPSATSLPSGGSNFGPTNPALAKAIGERAAALRAEGIEGLLPVDLLTASASGLDPHVSPDGALVQVDRVARARGLDPESLRKLVLEHVEDRELGVLGEPRVNVLELNLALDSRR
jgi:potassium-transporting ATPase KdpC subunit